MTDPIADMLTRIRNAYLSKKKTVLIPHSKMKEAVLKTLEREGYITGVEIINTDSVQADLKANLKYNAGLPVVSHLERVSKPGRRVYQGFDEIRPTLSGHGLIILSTSQGIMTGKEARKNKVGGEVLCRVW